MDKETANKKIATLLGWNCIPATKKVPFDLWHRPDGEEVLKQGGMDVGAEIPNYCGNAALAAEFRQHTMKQPWFYQFTMFYRDGKYTCDLGIIYEMSEDLKEALRIGSCIIPPCDTEEEASSIACLAAWEKMGKS